MNALQDHNDKNYIRNGLMTNIKNGQSFYNISLTVEKNRKILKWEANGNLSQPKIIHNNILNTISLFLKDLETDKVCNMPILAYSKSEMWQTTQKNAPIPENKYIKKGYNQLLCYNNFVKPRIHDFTDFIHFFDKETDYENTMRLESNATYRSPLLQVIRKTIEVFLGGITQMVFKNLKIKKHRLNHDLYATYSSSLVILKNNIELELNLLSSGEKSVLLLAIDIAMRLMYANPSLWNPLEGEGIVMIDEIELHLHPEWQRQIIPALLKTFPNCQFMITTHSPQVVSQVARTDIFILKDYELVQNTPYTYGKDSNSLLNEVFQTSERPAVIQKQLDECFKLIDLEKWDEVRILLQELANLLGEQDTEVLRARAML